MTEVVIIDDGLGDIRISPYGADSWVLLAPFVYTTDAGMRIEVPRGFLSDGASAPLHILIKAWGGHYSSAALIHDYLYVTKVNRLLADNILFEVMTKTGVNYWVKWSIWWVVRAFGGPLTRGLGVNQ